MRSAHYALLSVVVLGCATEQNDLPLGGLGNVAGGTSEGGSGGAAAGTGGNATAGSLTSGGGGASGGNPVSGGGGAVGTAGTFGMVGGMGGSATGGGGAGGMGGTATGGGGSGGGGGKAGGGAGGSMAGSGGTGGSAAVKCGDNAIRAKAQWTASASHECAPTCTDPNGPFTAALAIDPDTGTRFATGKAQAGDEWLQIDLGAVGTVNRVTINTVSATDYTRHYQVRVSNTSGDMAGQVLADGAGAAGVITINLNKTVNGRYVMISQTGNVGAATSWWSVNDVTVTCQ